MLSMLFFIDRGIKLYISFHGAFFNNRTFGSLIFPKFDPIYA
jgi:hypothetical protein